MIAVWACVLNAWGADVIESLGSSAVMDWGTLQVRVTAQATSPQPAAGLTTEQRARENVQQALDGVAMQLRLQPDVTLGSLLQRDDTLARQLRRRMQQWEVTDAEYRTSGQVILSAVMHLHEVLKPWALADVAPTRLGEGLPHTGVLLDTRDTGFRPCYKPRLVLPDGTLVYRSRQTEAAAMLGPPALYVADPADARAARVGDQPWMLRATSAKGCSATLADVDPASATTLQQQLQTAPWVIVVDAP